MPQKHFYRVTKAIIDVYKIISTGKSSQKKSPKVDGGSRLKSFDKELTDTSKKALKSFRQR